MQKQHPQHQKCYVTAERDVQVKLQQQVHCHRGPQKRNESSRECLTRKFSGRSKPARRLQSKLNRNLDKMNAYLNLNGNSSVRFYSIEPTRITVVFKDGRPYSYSYGRAGRDNVEQMKTLANRGAGLCSFIQRHVRTLYD